MRKLVLKVMCAPIGIILSKFDIQRARRAKPKG